MIGFDPRGIAFYDARVLETPTFATKRRGTLTRLVLQAAREPLVQFMAVAVVLFAINRLIHGPTTAATAEPTITISKGRVLQIADSYRMLSQHVPNRAELQALVDDFTDEEIDYREAVALGLDQDDTIVRRRMRQKLEFLAEDADATEEPSDDQLTKWLSSHAADYRLPERIAFRQVMVSGDTHGAKVTADATALLAKLKSGADPDKLGDASMLPSSVPLTTQQGVASLLGDAFSAAAFQHVGAESWFGPIASPYGAHLICVTAREPARDPALNEIRDKLRSDWIQARRLTQRDAMQARLRQRYQVKIDWPEPYASQPAPTEIPRIRKSIETLSSE